VSGRESLVEPFYLFAIDVIWQNGILLSAIHVYSLHDYINHKYPSNLFFLLK